MDFSKGMLRGAALLAVLSSLAACGGFKRQSELECMERAMYFESNRSSRDGMIAVGSVVMNQNAQFFHAASYRASYNNMHYVVTAGGNAFYERRRPELVTQPRVLPQIEGITGR